MMRSVTLATLAGSALLLSAPAPAAGTPAGRGTTIAGPQVRPDTAAAALPARPDTTAAGLKRLTVDDFARWRSIGQTGLSPDGRWATYAYSQRDVDDSLFVKPLGGGEPVVVVRGNGPEFSADSRWVAYTINPPRDSGGRRGAAAGGGGGGGRGRGRGGGGGPRDLQLRDLQTGDTVRWENVQAFAFANRGRALVLKKRAADDDAEYEGTDVVVRYLDAGEEELLPYVNEWALDEPGARLAYTIDGPGGEANGVHLLDLTTRARRVLDAEREVRYAQLTWGDEKDTPSVDALAVLKGKDDDDLVERVNALLAWPAVSEVGTPAVVLDPRPREDEVADEPEGAGGPGSRAPGGGSRSGGVAEGLGVRGGPRDGPSDRKAASHPQRASDRSAASGPGDPVNGLPADWVLSEEGSISWAPDATRLFVATRPQQPAPKTLCEPREETRRGGRGGRGGQENAADTSGAQPPDTTGSSPSESGAAATPNPVGRALRDSTTAPTIVNMASRYAPDGRPLGPEEVLDGTCPEFVADVDIWHVDDVRLQSVQILRADRDRRQTYESVVHVDDGRARFVRLADTTMERLQVSEDGRTAIGSDGRPYESDWLPSYSDYYRVDLDTGERTPILEKQLRTLGFSPDGEHFLYWKDGDVWSYQVASGAHVDLTGDVGASFVNEEYDRLGEKPPYGVAGWTADSTAVILEQRYDLWKVPLDGGPATDLTGGVGTEREIQFRILDLDPDEDLTNLDEPVYLTAYGQWTKKAGFYRLEDGDLEELVYDDARFGRVEKADSADVLLYIREDFRTFPDYRVSGPDFSDPKRITDANPQQGEYNWGRTVLFDYQTKDGVRLQGVLAIPDDYRPGERRPLLVDFYEKMSQNLHDYPAPIFRDTPMVAHYVSAGYLFLRPDVHYRLGDTHAQMLESINLALDEVEAMGYVDPERIGLHGHSFSGQGSDYIATHSDRFAAIVAGAGAADLVSDFNQLWKSAGTNQHGYDTYGQGRFATNPYDDLELFMDQSGTFNAADMNTPLLLLHGTSDGSVEWLQAVEFYNALRWFGKNVILASYPGEPHHLSKYENQKDFQIRMRQFYDHYLMGKPAPRWMTEGRTFLQKERDRAMMEGEEGNGGGGGGGGGG